MGGGLKNKTEKTKEVKVTEKEMFIFGEASPAQVMELIGRTGNRGEISQVRCKILEGQDKNKIIRRNVKGPIAVGHILMLRETELEASPLSGRRK